MNKVTIPIKNEGDSSSHDGSDQVQDLLKQNSILLAELDEYKESIRVLKEQQAKDLTALQDLIRNLEFQVSNSTALLTENISSTVYLSIVKILGDCIKKEDCSINAILQTIGEVDVDNIVCLHISPKDYETFLSSSKKYNFDSKINFVSDEKVVVGGCIIDFVDGVSDARVETQLHSLRNIFKDTFSNA